MVLGMRYLIAQAYLSAVFMVMVGCSPSSVPITSIEPQPISTSTEARREVTAAVTPTTSSPTAPYGEIGGRLTVVVEADTAHLDVQQDISETLAARGAGIAYSRLMRLKSDPGLDQPNLLVECELCTEWELLDPWTFRFKLRDDVRWQNVFPVGGRRLDANDLLFSYTRQSTEGWPNAPLLKSVKEIRVESDGEFLVDLNYPDADFLLALANGHSKIIPHESINDETGRFQGPVVGSGAWIWKSSSPGVGTMLERNKNYFEGELPFVEEIVFQIIDDSETQVAALLADEIDVLNISNDGWEILQSYSATPRTIYSKQSGKGIFIAFNTGLEPFASIVMRRQILASLNPWVYVDDIWDGQSFVSPGIPVIESSWLMDREEIETLLRDPVSSVPASFVITVADFGDIYLDQALRIQEDLRNTGFDPILDIVNPIDYAQQVWVDGEFQMLVGPMPPNSGPNGFLFPILHSGGEWNLLGHGDDELDLLIEKQHMELFDSQARAESIFKIQRHIVDQAYMLGLGDNVDRWVTNDEVRGFFPNPALSEYSFWSKVWIDE
tara:strand:+ start:276 stop:1934 length:1659 start_codon:yes stop_codon:yes gene_type:complete